ncbi:MAG TPA: acyloxyacyl hydrolase [Eoetvoesiella sp.]|jgi:lipid A 3-O-deacylase|uniref:acyloxyacyl hydrolase n=1 Tax=Eoetvoesiella sp. TaxID=1966355 RepID=UPI002B638E44|nr:acyloxyacyl hydrolase [Eoetvoesiella sp.]HWK62393.1 acyloxyacyl hydrolase [Eoetvoesiella sp.]
MRKTCRRSARFAASSLILAGALFSAAGQAASLRNEANGGISLRAGSGDHFERYELAWESPSLWSHRFSGNNGRLDLVGELGAAYWTADHSPGPSHAWQFSAIPFLRWTIDQRFYIEAGVGATVFTRTRFAGKEMSSAFQFGDHLGLGVYLSESSRVGLRLSHFSNADIKTPNPGLNIVQLTYTYQY